MTGPAGGGGGFIEGDDYVALRLNLDIPTEAVNGVQTITKEVEKYQVAMEAAIRAEADMASYADKMAESIKKASEAQDTMTEQLKTYLQLSGKITAQGHGQSSGVPQGPHQQPWEPGTAGTGAAPVPPGARMPSPSDVVYQLGDRAGKTHADAASYLNMQHQRGGVPDTVAISPESIKSLANQIADRETALSKQADHTKHPGSAPQRPSHPSSRHPSPSDPFDQFQQRVESFGGLANQVMNEVGGGGGMGHMALQGLNYARKKLEERSAKTDADSSGGGDNEGSGNPDSDTSKKGMGGIAKTLGIGGGIAAAALAAFGLVEKGGQMVQGWRNIASTRGGGAGEGFQLEMKQRVMAMDPMLTTEQTREIMQATLSNGYADASGNGPQAGEITNYLKNNIKNYNMSVSESMELLKLTAHTTKVSVTELNGALYTLQQMSKGGSQSQQELQRQFRERWGQLESQGVDEKAAMASALQATGVFFDNPQLAGSFASTSFSGAMGAEEGVFGGPGGTPMTDMPNGLLPQNYGRFNENMGRGPEAELNVLLHYAQSAQAAGPDTSGGVNTKGNAGWLNATTIFHDSIQHLLSGNSPYRSLTMSSRLYNQLIWGVDSNGKPLPKDPKEIIAQANEKTRKYKHDLIKTPGHGVTGFTIPGIGAFPFGGEGIVPDKYTTKAENDIINVFGQGGIEVKGPNGKWEDLDPANQAQAEGIANDKYKWRRKGVDTGEGITIDDTPSGINSDFKTDDPENPAGLGSSDKSGDSKSEVTGTLTIKIDRDGNVSAPSSVPLTANNDAANKGAGDAQVNDPPIGDAILDWGKHIFTGGKGSFF